VISSKPWIPVAAFGSVLDGSLAFLFVVIGLHPLPRRFTLGVGSGIAWAARVVLTLSAYRVALTGSCLHKRQLQVPTRMSEG
jgi:hypothetical protein